MIQYNCFVESEEGCQQLNRIQSVKQKIQYMNEVEAKSILLLIYAKLDNAIDQGDEELLKETAEEIFDLYHKLPHRILN